MENLTRLVTVGAFSFTEELNSAEGLPGGPLPNAARSRSALDASEFSHALDQALHRKSTSAIENATENTTGWTGDSTDDSRSAHLTSSLPNAKSSERYIDALTGIAAAEAQVGTRAAVAQVNSKASADPNRPDLVGVVDDVTMPRTIDPRKKDDKGKIKVDVINRGNARASGALVVNIYASPDLTLDSSDQLLDTVNRGNVQIQANKTRKFTFDFTNPAGVAPGAYYLIVDIDPRDTVAESNENNNAAHQRVSASGTDVVLDWNATILNAIVATRSSPPVASRNMAILHTAIYEAVNANMQQPFSQEAAVAAASHQVLLNFYPTEAPVLREQLDLSLSEIANGQAKTRGIELGRSIADTLLRERSTDGSNVPSSYTPKPDAGYWQPTPPANAAAVLPQWGRVKPFTLQSGSQFRPSGPPRLTSAEYAADLNQVKALGSQNSANRTADQKETALFWADGAGTFTPPGHWNLIAEQLAVTKRNTLAENARLFALLNCAEADAGIAAWDAKYVYDLWRPVTAVRRADQDGNDATIVDPTWTPLIITPPFPEYVSGHSTFSGAASTILASVFGDNTNFVTTSIGLPGVVRSFTSFTEAAEEAGMSRVYGGIHFNSANRDGLAMGRSVGRYTISESPFVTGTLL